MTTELLWRLLEKEVVPDAIVRAAIRGICAERLREQRRGGVEAQRERAAAYLAARRDGPIARHTVDANRQHYEVPPPFFRHVLGRRMKYSSGYWHGGVRNLDQAEDAMLELTCERALVEDGQRILDLGCGWGALSLWIAEHHPRARVIALSNSASQRDHIRSEAERRGHGDRVTAMTADVNTFDFAAAGPFDRIVSVEMFEHMWNHEELMRRLASALAPGGRLFVHIFAHARFAYPFEDRGATDWMARTFFTGGSMLSDDALVRAQRDLVLEEHWRLAGTHYAFTAEAWLANLDRGRDAIDPILASTYGPDRVARWRLNWRLFFLACAELFGYRRGQEWIVSHYRFRAR